MDAFRNVTDPMGNVIQLTNNLCGSDGNPFDITDMYDEVVHVIEKPAFIVSVSDDKIRHYYFRLIGRDDSLMIGAVKMSHHWYASECFHNPAPDLIKYIYLSGHQVY